MARNKFRFPNQGARELNSFTSWNTISTGLNSARSNTRRLGAAFSDIQSSKEGREEIRYRQFTAGIGGLRGKIGGESGEKIDASVASFLKSLKSAGGHKIGNFDLSKSIGELHKEIERIASTMGGIQGSILKDFTKSLKDAQTAASKGGLGAIGGGTKDAIKTAFGLKADNSIEEARKKIADEVTQAAKALSTEALKQSVAQVIDEMNRLSGAAKTSAEKQKVLADAQAKLSQIRGTATGNDKTVMEGIVKSTNKNTSELNKDLIGQASNRKGLEFNNRLANLTNALGLVTRYLVPIKRTLDVGNALFQSVNSKFNQFARMQMRVSAERGGFGRQVRGAGVNYGHMMAAIGAGRSAGMEDRQVVGQMVGLQTQLAQARWGEGGLAENVGRWGISVYNGAGDVKQAHELMIEFSRKLRSLGSDMEKLQFLHAIGRSPEEMEYVANYEKSARRMDWLKKNPHMMGVLDRADMLDESGLNAKADAATKLELRRREILNQNAIEKGPFEALARSLNPENWLFNDWTARQKGVQQAKGEMAMERLIRAINAKIRQDEKLGRKTSDFSTITAQLSPEDIASLAAIMQKDKANAGDKSVASEIEKDYIRNQGIAFDTRTPIEKLSDAFAPLTEKLAQAIEKLVSWLAENKGTGKVVDALGKGADFVGDHPVAAGSIAAGGLLATMATWAGIKGVAKWGGKKLFGKIISKFRKGKGGGDVVPPIVSPGAHVAPKVSDVEPKVNAGGGRFNNGARYNIDNPDIATAKEADEFIKASKDAGKAAAKGAGKSAAESAGKAAAKGAGKSAAESAGKAAAKGAVEVAAKGAGKAAAKAGAKGVGKSLAKKIPFLGWIPALWFAGQRAFEGDWFGAGGEVASGAAGSIPGIGTAASAAIDASLLGRDVYRAVNSQGSEGIAPGSVSQVSPSEWTSHGREELTSSHVEPVTSGMRSDAISEGQKLIETIRELIRSNKSLEEVQELLAKNKISASLDAVKSDKFMTSNTFANQVMQGGQALNILEEYASKTGKAISYDEYANKVNKNKYIRAAVAKGVDYTRGDQMAAATGKGTFSRSIMENYLNNPMSDMELAIERSRVREEHGDWSNKQVEREVKKRASKKLTREDYENARDAIIEEEREIVRVNDKGNWVGDEGSELAGNDGKPIHVADITEEDLQKRKRMLDALNRRPDVAKAKVNEKLLTGTDDERQAEALRIMQEKGIGDVSHRKMSQKFKSEQLDSLKAYMQKHPELDAATVLSDWSADTGMSLDASRNLVWEDQGARLGPLKGTMLSEANKGSAAKNAGTKERIKKAQEDRQKSYREAVSKASKEELTEALGGESGQANTLQRLLSLGDNLNEDQIKARDTLLDRAGRKLTAGKNKKDTAFKPLHDEGPSTPDKEEEAALAKSKELVKQQKAAKGRPPLAQISDVRYMHSIRARGGGTKRDLERGFGKERMEQYNAAEARGELSPIDSKILKRERITMAKQARHDKQMAKAGVVRSGFPMEGDATQKMATAGAQTAEASKNMAAKGAAAESAAASAKNAMGGGGSGGATERNITINMGGQTITQNIQGAQTMDAEGMKSGTAQGGMEIANKSAQAVKLASENIGHK